MHPQREGLQYIKEYWQGSTGGGAIDKGGTVVTHESFETDIQKQNSLKAVHFKVNKTTALLYDVKIGVTGN